MTIYKYPLAFNDVQIVRMPPSAKILAVQMQGAVLCLWALVDENLLATEDRKIEIFGTGHRMPEEGKRDYMGTVQMSGGSYVWHIFEAQQP